MYDDVMSHNRIRNRRRTGTAVVDFIGVVGSCPGLLLVVNDFKPKYFEVRSTSVLLKYSTSNFKMAGWLAGGWAVFFPRSELYNNYS